MNEVDWKSIAVLVGQKCLDCCGCSITGYLDDDQREAYMAAEREYEEARLADSIESTS